MIDIDVKNTIAERIEVMRESTGLNKKQFAEFLGINEKTLGSYTRAGAMPSLDFLISAYNRDFSLEFVLLGEGEMSRAKRDEAAVAQAVSKVWKGYAKPADRASDNLHRVSDVSSDTGGRSNRLCQFARYWMETRAADDQAWLEKQIERAVPEYADWKKREGR